VGQTALHVACLWGNVDSAKALIDLKANIDAQNDFNGGSPLHCAADGNPRFDSRKLFFQVV
jgi:ankyrin repeat protein